jgi:virulence factor
MKSLRVGIIGLGNIARQIYLPFLSGNPSVEIKTIFARTPETREKVKFAYGLKHCSSSFDEFCNQDMDCAFVLSPKDSHYEYVIPLLEKGMAVFCEKPMATSLQQAREMIEMAQKTKRVLMFAFNRRYAPVYISAHEMFAIKPPEMVIARKNRPGLEYRATIENTIHMIDLLNWFCGEAIEVQAYSQFDNPEYEKGIMAAIRFKNGSMGMVSASRDCGRWDEKVSFYGNGMTVEVDSPTETLIYKDGQISGLSVIGKNTGFVEPVNTLGFRSIVAEFFEAVQTGKKPSLTLESVLQTQLLLNEILKKGGLPDLE